MQFENTCFVREMKDMGGIEICEYKSTINRTGSSNYRSTVTPAVSGGGRIVFVNSFHEMKKIKEAGQYSIYEIADWFLSKESMTQNKLQKLCYYAQAWCYALKNKRLIRTDFQAWIYGPVSPALYERFKSFGYDAIRYIGAYKCRIDKEDVSLLEDVWETYGDQTGNSLTALTQRELPWIEARRGYTEDERCTVVISSEVMKRYYKSIEM